MHSTVPSRWKRTGEMACMHALKSPEDVAAQAVQCMHQAAGAAEGRLRPEWQPGAVASSGAVEGQAGTAQGRPTAWWDSSCVHQVMGRLPQQAFVRAHPCPPAPPRPPRPCSAGSHATPSVASSSSDASWPSKSCSAPLDEAPNPAAQDDCSPVACWNASTITPPRPALLVVLRRL